MNRSCGQAALGSSLSLNNSGAALGRSPGLREEDPMYPAAPETQCIQYSAWARFDKPQITKEPDNHYFHNHAGYRSPEDIKLIDSYSFACLIRSSSDSMASGNQQLEFALSVMYHGRRALSLSGHHPE